MLTTIAVSDAAGTPKGWNGFLPGMSMQEASELIRSYRWPDSILFERDSADLDPKKPLFFLAGVAIERKPELYSKGEKNNNVPEGVSPNAKGTAMVDSVTVSFRPADNLKVKAYIESFKSLTCEMVKVTPDDWAEVCGHAEEYMDLRLILYSNPTFRSTVSWTMVY
jgi:hypothetical protein